MGLPTSQGKKFKRVFSDADIQALKIMSRSTIDWKIELERKRHSNRHSSAGQADAARQRVVNS
jgi:hypothetical protein